MTSAAGSLSRKTNWHRYYDPVTGRYVSADPIGLWGGFNLYAYASGDPINKIDFSGLTSCPNIQYHFVSECIEENEKELEKCKCNGGNPQICERNAKDKLKICLKNAYNKCSGDLNKDGKVDSYDEWLWILFRRLWDLRTPPFTPFPPGYGDERPGAIDPNIYPVNPQT
jgi:hypothetical protein